MPATQQHSHLFSAIDSLLHHRQHASSHTNSYPNPGGAAPAGHHLGSSSSAAPLQAFESRLSERLSSLAPADDSSWFSLSSFNKFMDILLDTQTGLRSLIPSIRTERRSMDEFLERSVKVLDICRDIKEQIADVESLHGMLELVGPCLMPKERSPTCEGEIRRARKILTQLLALVRVEDADSAHQRHVQARLSFRDRLRERLSGHYSREGSLLGNLHFDGTVSPGHAINSTSPPRSFSGQGQSSSSGRLSQSNSSIYTSTASNGQASEVIRALHSLELSLIPPKLTTRDEEECFASAVYALNVMSVFFLGTITAAFPSLGIGDHAIGAIHPPNFSGWTAAFLRVQEKVQQDLRGRARSRTVHAGIWDLDILFCLIKGLLELATTTEQFPWSAHDEERLKESVSQFDRHVRELKTDLMIFSENLTNFYNRIISARSEVFAILSHAGVA